MDLILKEQEKNNLSLLFPTPIDHGNRKTEILIKLKFSLAVTNIIIPTLAIGITTCSEFTSIIPCSLFIH